MTDNLRLRLASTILNAAEDTIDAEWLCCPADDIRHELCRDANNAWHMIKALFLDDPDADQPSPVMDAVMETVVDYEAGKLADQTMLKGMTVKDGGVNLEMIPPREIAAVWAHIAIGMLGDAPNYTETEVMPSVSLEISPAGTFERYALIVQRVGKLTPHEARQQAERERDEWRARAKTAQQELEENTGVLNVLRRQRDEAEVAVSRVRELAERWGATDPGTRNELLAAVGEVR